MSDEFNKAPRAKVEAEEPQASQTEKRDAARDANTKDHLTRATSR